MEQTIKAGERRTLSPNTFPPDTRLSNMVARVRQKAVLYFAVVSALLVLTAVAGIAIGSTHIDWAVILRVVAARLLPEGWLSLAGVGEAEQAIVWLIRVPRVVVAAIVGAALAVAGAQMQGLFRNPLAEPSIIGASAGAALGAVIAFVTALTMRSALWLPLLAFLGALLALFFVYSFATRAGRAPTATLLLAGIALSALISAISSLLISLSFIDWEVAGNIIFWMMGGLDNRTWIPRLDLSAVACCRHCGRSLVPSRPGSAADGGGDFGHAWRGDRDIQAHHLNHLCAAHRRGGGRERHHWIRRPHCSPHDSPASGTFASYIVAGERPDGSNFSDFL